MAQCNRATDRTATVIITGIGFMQNLAPRTLRTRDRSATAVPRADAFTDLMRAI
jgi:hypothetical protein